MSTGSGDIFIPIGYLNMVANRDEIAFGLAREIAVQHRLLHLQDMEKRYQENQRAQMISYLSSLVISTAISATFNYYVISPMHHKIMSEIGGSNDPTTYFWTRKTAEDVGTLLNFALGWTPSMISSRILGLVSNLIVIVEEESDKSQRTRKNELGLVYLKVAGFEPSAGQEVIAKMEKWWSHVETQK